MQCVYMHMHGMHVYHIQNFCRTTQVWTAKKAKERPAGRKIPHQNEWIYSVDMEYTCRRHGIHLQRVRTVLGTFM